MYIPDLPKALSSRSIVDLNKSYFTLDTSGVAGFFGGVESASAMATVHICKNRKEWGWYNSPGSYEIARRYGLLTKFGFVFGGGHTDPAELLTLFELDGRKGPPFLRVHSGNIIPETDHLASVFMKECPRPECPIKPKNGRQPVRVTIAELNSRPGGDIERRPLTTSWNPRILAALPIIVSAITCVICGITQDWYSFSLILLGIIANGVTCLVIGSLKLKFMYPKLAGELDQKELVFEDTKQRHVSGIFVTATDIILLKGREDAAMAVACGKLVLPPPPGGRLFYRYIGWCSILLLIQFIAQLLVIPQASLFGQIMFVTSLGASWLYNLWLCSLDKATIQQRILFETILNLEEGDIQTYGLANWPAMVVFVLLTLVSEDEEIRKEDLETMFGVLVEDTDMVWKVWKSTVLELLQTLMNRTSLVTENDLNTLIKKLDVKSGEANGLSRRDGLKLNALLKEGQSGIEAFKSRVSRVSDVGVKAY